jgi:hypothetical protein
MKGRVASTFLQPEELQGGAGWIYKPGKPWGDREEKEKKRKQKKTKEETTLFPAFLPKQSTVIVALSIGCSIDVVHQQSD